MRTRQFVQIGTEKDAVVAMTHRAVGQFQLPFFHVPNMTGKRRLHVNTWIITGPLSTKLMNCSFKFGARVPVARAP